MEISVQESSSIARKMESDELIKLLKDCGAVKGGQAYTFAVARREAKELYKDFCILREEEYIKDKDRSELQQHTMSSEEKVEARVDWCHSKAELYHQYWTNLMKYPASFSSDDREKAADLGIQVKNLRLVQMAGSRILVLDGGGMKGLVEIEILDQIERVTGMKILDLFDWIVGTSTGAVIALALVYGELT